MVWLNYHAWGYINNSAFATPFAPQTLAKRPSFPKLVPSFYFKTCFSRTFMFSSGIHDLTSWRYCSCSSLYSACFIFSVLFSSFAFGLHSLLVATHVQIYLLDLKQPFFCPRVLGKNTVSTTSVTWFLATMESNYSVEFIIFEMVPHWSICRLQLDSVSTYTMIVFVERESVRRRVTDISYGCVAC